MQDQSRQGRDTNQSRDKKRAQFAEPARPKSRVKPVLGVLVAVLVAIAAYLVFIASGDKPAATTITPPAQTAAGSNAPDIRIPVADVSNKAKFFDYTLSNDKPIRFFVMKSSDGVYRAALDACDVCYHAKKGYTQEGDEMVCNNCGLKFHSALINEASGGCNPVGLPRSVDGDHLVIKATELEKGGKYF